MIESNTIWRVRETAPGRTTPRLQNVVQYIYDLGWIKKEGELFKISNTGMNILMGNE